MEGRPPHHPVLVSQFSTISTRCIAKWKAIELRASPAEQPPRGASGGKYVFIADEVYRNGNVEGAKTRRRAACMARCRL
jgi:hypothetical protein